MLSVPVHKDVTEYQPKVIGGLTARTIICIGAAVGCALAFGLLCTFVFHVDINEVIYLVWLAAAPAALIGFYTPHGMNFEKFAPLWLALFADVGVCFLATLNAMRASNTENS